MKPKRLTPQQLKTQQQLDRISSAFKQAMAAAQYPKAMQEALRAHKLIPQSVAPLSDAATAAVKGSLWHEAIVYAKKALQRQSGHLNSLDALAHAYGGLHDWANCRTYGLQALQLRDSQVMAALDAAPPLPALSANRPGKQIISFSLFGNRAEYIEPAVMNTELAAAVYPGWVCRFYVDGSVPEPALQRLRGNGAEIVRVPPELENWPGTMWRFLALDDAEAARVIFRDADSVISPREARAVAEWVQSGRCFHTLRDGGTHTELVLAGLWGALACAVSICAAKCRLMWMRAWLRAILPTNGFCGKISGLMCAKACAPTTVFSALWMPRLFPTANRLITTISMWVATRATPAFAPQSISPRAHPCAGACSAKSTRCRRMTTRLPHRMNG